MALSSLTFSKFFRPLGFRPILKFIPRRFNYSLESSKSVNTELEAVKAAIKADETQEKKPQVETDKRLLIGFTCKCCQHRTHRTMSHQAYHHGIVLIECPGCQSHHLIADNLGWFKDTPKAAKKIEDMTEVVGEIRRSLNLSEKENKGLVELLKD